MEFTLKPVGDCAASALFGDVISPEINQKVCAFQAALERAHIDGIVETVPTYTSLMIHYDPERILWDELERRLRALGAQQDDGVLAAGRVWELPVLYGGEFGPDLQVVSAHSGLPPEEVVRIHTSGSYLVYMMGFLPGFPYLGGMDPRIAAPRLATPRVSIPAGSVGIAGSQTGIYPIASPGGWQLIGRTPARLYAPERNDPFLIRAGDRIRFIAIDQQTFCELEEQERQGTASCRLAAGQEEPI